MFPKSAPSAWVTLDCLWNELGGLCDTWSRGGVITRAVCPSDDTALQDGASPLIEGPWQGGTDMWDPRVLL